jgi:hypothetical protein
MHKQLRRAGLAGVLGASVAGLAVPPCAAQGPPDAATDAATDAAAAAPVLASARQGVRSTTEWLARGVDSWFGDKPFSEGGKVTDGRLSLVLLSRQHEKPDFSVRFNVRLWLPNLEDRAYLFLGRDDAREAVTDQPDAFSRQQQLPRDNQTTPTAFAGLGWLLQDTLQLRLGLRGGLKPYAHLRYARTWRPDDQHQLDLRETVFWTPDDRLGSTTVLSLERSQSSTLALRWLSSATITRDVGAFAWASKLGAYRSFGTQQLLSAEWLLNGQQGSGVAVTDWGLQLKWEQPVHQDWLLGEVLVGHFWPRAAAPQPRRRAWALGASLKMAF